MIARTRKSNVGVLHLLPLIACVMAGWSCSQPPPPAPTPTPTKMRQATPIPPAATATAQPPAAAQPAEAVATAPAAPQAVKAGDGARRAQCERYIGVLSGDVKDPALLQSPEVAVAAGRAPDLVACGAVKADSDALCETLGKALAPGKKDYATLTKDCTFYRYLFHELRTYPNGRSFMFDQYNECIATQQAAECDKFRDILRSGDASQCAKMGKYEPLCKAFINLDPAYCPKEGKDQPACKKPIAEKAHMGKGLKAMTQSGSAQQRELARAALGEADACKVFAEPAIDKCVANEPTPGAQEPAVSQTFTPPPAPTSAPTSPPKPEAPGAPAATPAAEGMTPAAA